MRCGSHGLRVGRLLLAFSLVTAAGCKRRNDREGGPSGPMSRLQADAAIARAIRSSNEGVILLPSKKAERVYELPRLNEIAQELRQPAAVCFLAAALQSMERADEAESGWAGVPDGQVKIRARVSPSGYVMRTEVLESGFAAVEVPDCVARAVKDKKFPENTTGNTHYLDVIYWVSLGMAADTKKIASHLRREQTEAAIRAKQCFKGRMPEGGYWVDGLNLVGRDGSTMANRVDQAALPEEVRACVAQALRGIRLPAAPDSFVRPVAPRIRFDVLPEDRIRVKDEEWLRLVKLEERAQREGQRADLLSESGDAVPRGSVDVSDAPDPGPDVSPDVATEPEERTDPAGDPAQGGLKLDLGGRKK